MLEANKPENLGEAIKILEEQVEALKMLGADREARDLEPKLHELQVRQYYNEGLAVYADGSPEDVVEAIKVLNRTIELLDKLEATRESQDLKKKRKLLQIRECENSIEAERTTIAEAKTQTDHFASEDVFQHYERIDEAYQRLAELEPRNPQRVGERRTNLEEEAEYRHKCATRAERGQDYEAALRHYRRIHKIGQMEIMQGLDISDLPETIKRAEAKLARAKEHAYDLIYDQDYPGAIKRLQKTAQSGYDYPDVPWLLWGLVYARDHEGTYPPGWDYPVSGLKDIPQPRSSIPSIIREISHLLLEYEKAIEQVVVAKPDMLEEMSGIRFQMQAQLEDLQGINWEAAAQKLESLLQDIGEDRIPTDLPGMLKLIEKIKQERDAGREDPEIDALQAIVSKILAALHVAAETRDRLEELGIPLLAEDQEKRLSSLERLEKYNGCIFVLFLLAGVIIGGLIVRSSSGTLDLNIAVVALIIIACALFVTVFARMHLHDISP